MRITKYIAHCGYTSRRKAKNLIEEGKVRVNGKLVFDLNYQVLPEKDILTIDKDRIQLNRSRYLILNKPVGFVCSKRDEYGRKTVYDIVRDRSLNIAGRLDINSEGLVFMSNDGEFINFLTHPSNKIIRTYRIKIRGIIDKNFILSLKGKHETNIDKYFVDNIDNISYTRSNTWFDISIHEGKKREIRNLTKFYNLQLVRLIRVRLGLFTIDGIEKGRYLEIPNEKILQIKRSMS